jgi:hypothetical protein
VLTVTQTGTTTAFVPGVSGAAVPTLYYGRVVNPSTSSTGTNYLKFSESSTALIPSGGLLTLTANVGKNMSVSSNATGGAAAFACTASSTTPVTTCTTTVSTANGTTTYNNLAVTSLDLTGVSTAGSLTVAVGGNATITPQTVTIGNITNATNASVSGAMPTLIPGSTAVTLPDVVISETNAGALVAGRIGLKLPAGITFDNAAAPTVTVTKADGTTALTGKVGTASVNNYVANAGGTSLSTYNLDVTSGSLTADGPMTIKVSGLKAKAATTASTGSISLLIHGSTGTATTAAAAADETTSASNVGAMPTSTSIAVANVGSATAVTAPPATVTGPVTSQSITAALTPAGNDVGKQGSVFVAAVLPSSAGGGVYFMSSTGAWTLYSTCTTVPVYSTGTIGAVTGIPVVTSYNLTSLIGTSVYVGYGAGGALSPAGTACTNMLNNGTYALSYTVVQ